VAIVGGAAGVRAISSDGARQRTLVDGPAAWVLVDHRSDVVWFGSADTTEIRAIDLDAPATAPIEVHTVVTGLPDGDRVAMVGPPRYEVLYPSSEPGISEGEAWFSATRFATGVSWDMNLASVQLGVSAEPAIAADSGYVRDEAWDAEAGKATIGDRAFLAALLARPDRTPAAEPRPPETRVDGIDPANSEEPADCGKAEPIAGTHFWRVMTTNVMGDVRHITWQLYDVDAHRLLEPEWATWLQGGWIAPDHRAFVAGGVIVRLDGSAPGPVAATPVDDGGLGGGWLGGGTLYE
jgi:hypothetical protein